METLVLVAQHRNQYYGNGDRRGGPARFGSLPSKGFRDVSCRAYESGAGLLPSPCKGYWTPVLNQGFLSPRPRTPPCGGNNGVKSKSVDPKPLKKVVKTSPIDIKMKGSGKKERLSRESFLLSEKWAGPAYSNSPPPSSLPMPKFSVKPKRTVSLELPAIECEVNLEPMAKSAPATPRESDRASSPFDFLRNEDSATKTLRRILNLDIADD